MQLLRLKHHRIKITFLTQQRSTDHHKRTISLGIFPFPHLQHKAQVLLGAVVRSWPLPGRVVKQCKGHGMRLPSGTLLRYNRKFLRQAYFNLGKKHEYINKIHGNHPSSLNTKPCAPNIGL